MTTVQLIQALVALLIADRDGVDASVQALIPGRDATAAAWPASASVRFDPRFLFFDEVNTPTVRICLESEGTRRESANSGSVPLTVTTERLCLGFAMRVDGEDDFAAFLAWGQYLADFLNSVNSISNWTQQRPGEWAFRHDAEWISTNGDTIVGQMIGLYLMDWSAIT